ncbi:hypothetical protein EJ609_10425 [Pseudomonas aeruginosa]|nr:hypothetical protein EJ609_10425 [Pseudomonas aeruginosa]
MGTRRGGGAGPPGRPPPNQPPPPQLPPGPRRGGAGRRSAEISCDLSLFRPGNLCWFPGSEARSFFVPSERRLP